ncbi:MAG: hypothetical protein Q8L90_15315 [Bacteroidota bacterium]|nr:hypothetical protein [Bacteroidota bacterium]
MKTKMRNTLLVLIGLSSAAFAGEPVINSLPFKSAQDGEKSFNENTHIINIGIGSGGNRYYRGSGYDVYGRSPAFSLSYEQPWRERLGPGFLGVGAYFGYQNAHYRNNHYTSSNYYYEHNWNYMMIAARAIYHWDVLNAANAEVYGGAILGLRIQTYNYSTNNPFSNGDNRLNEGSVYPAFSIIAGARWYFAKKVAVYGEVGSGISYLTAGLSFKF